MTTDEKRKNLVIHWPNRMVKITQTLLKTLAVATDQRAGSNENQEFRSKWVIGVPYP